MRGKNAITNLLYLAAGWIMLLQITACHKPSTALPSPNNNSNHDTSNIDTPTVSNSLYDSVIMYLTKEMSIYRDISGIDSIGRYIECDAHLNHIDTIPGLAIRANGIKLSFSSNIQWWIAHFDSSITPDYPIYDSALIQFIAPNGFEDLDYKMPYMPFYVEPIPYLVSKDSGLTINVIANNLSGADSLAIFIVGGRFDTTVKITDCSIYIDSARMHQIFSSSPSDGVIVFHAFKWYNVTSHSKKYSILNRSVDSYQLLVE